MKLYNTLTQKIELVKPQNPPEVKLYTCGPTVYDYPHLGNWFSFIRYDLLVRSLAVSGYKVKWVMNITDVGHLVSDADEGEDKLEKGARREGKNAWQIALAYSDYFQDGLKRLNFIQPTYLVKATDHIKDQIELIQKLESLGYTYQIDDGVYYDTSKFPSYADFARLDLDEQQSTIRLTANPQKLQAADFALWKFSPKDHQRDMEWDSPWGKGFPGWHIECSAISLKYLGPTLDIHAGGIDHIPVHHSNEIAQSQPITGKPLANLWLHTNHITIEGEKISKSAGNAITLEDVEAKGLSLESLRLYVLESNYRTQSKFSWVGLTAAQSRLKSIEAMADLVWQPRDGNGQNFDFDKIYNSIEKLILNDLDSPGALAKLSQIQTKLETDLIDSADTLNFKNFLLKLDRLFGTKLSNRSDINQNQYLLIKKRETARSAKNWSQADQIRTQLQNQSITIRDTSLGPIWSRI